MAVHSKKKGNYHGGQIVHHICIIDLLFKKIETLSIAYIGSND
jgi:hypothetical protein